jgi:hypothetical protein
MERCTDERSLLVALGNALPFPTTTARTARHLKTASAICFVRKPERRPPPRRSDRLMRSNLHEFVRSVHLLLDVVTDVERASSEGFSSRSSLSVSWMRSSLDKRRTDPG